MTNPAPWVARHLLPAAVVFMLAPASGAQRREGSTGDVRLEVTLATPVKFAEQVVAPRLYRVTFGDGKLSLADAGTMVIAATVPVVESAGTSWVAPATVEVRQKGTVVEVVVKSGDRVYVASGAPADATPGATYNVALAKSDASIDLGGDPAQQSDRDLVAQALKRYGQDVKRCAEKAQKSNWATDDARFVKCVCPSVKKWRMPKVATELRMHHELAKGRSGMSFTVATDGKVKSCRVWVGAAPPADELTPAAPVGAAP